MLKRILSWIFPPGATKLKYEYPDYPGGGPFKGEDTCAYSRRIWAALPLELRRRCIDHLRESTWLEPQADDIRAKIVADPGGWVIEYHHGWGTGVRNELRSVVFDDKLPTGCWDDYYSAAVEDALGVEVMATGTVVT